MPKMKVRIAHDLPEKEVAVQIASGLLTRVSEASPKAIGDYSQKRWDGRSYQITLSFMGVKITGDIFVTALEVEFYADIPFQSVHLCEPLKRKFLRQMSGMFCSTSIAV